MIYGNLDIHSTSTIYNTSEVVVLGCVNIDAQFVVTSGNPILSL